MEYKFTGCQVACYALGLDEDKGCADGVRSNIQLYGDVMNILGRDVEVFRTDKYHVNTVREGTFSKHQAYEVRTYVACNDIARILLEHDYGHISFGEAEGQLKKNAKQAFSNGRRKGHMDSVKRIQRYKKRLQEYEDELQAYENELKAYEEQPLKCVKAIIRHYTK